MRKGRVLVIGDEYLALIGAAGGAHSIVYHNCGETTGKLREVASDYAVLITYKDILSECREILSLIDE